MGGRMNQFTEKKYRRANKHIKQTETPFLLISDLQKIKKTDNIHI